MNTLKDFVNFRLTHADKIAEAEGYPLKMENCKKYKKMKQLEIYGNSFQNGTPTPDAPVEVVSVGEKSANEVDIPDLNETVVNSYFMQYGTADGYKTDIIAKPNTTYYIRFKAVINSATAEVYTSVGYGDDGYRYDIKFNDETRSKIPWNSNEIGREIIIEFSITTPEALTTSSGTSYLCTRLCRTATPSSFDVDISDIYISTEPYGKYKIPVIARGKNIATAYDVCKGLASYKATVLDGRECVSYHSNWAKWYTDYPFKENTQYIISFDVKSLSTGTNAVLGFNCILGFWYTDGTFGSANYNPPDAAYNNDKGIDVEWRRVVLTSRAGKTVKSIGVDGNHYVMKHHIDVNTFQLEEGAANTGYEPYIEPVTTNIFLDEPLRKLGDYADYIDFKENKVIRNIDKKLVNDETDDKWMWLVNYDTEDALSVYRDGYINYSNPPYQSSHEILSSYFPYNFYNKTNKNRVWNYYSSCGFIISTDLIDGYSYSWSNRQKIDAFLQWAKNIGLDWYLARKTPREEPLNIDLPKLTAKTSIIEVDTNLLPSNAYGKYIKK